MNTIFKEGQKVYDQVNYPDCEGKVIKLYDDSILVIFEGVENYYSFDGRAGDGLPTLSTRPYKVKLEGFEQKPSAPTIEDAKRWKIKQLEGKTLGKPNDIEIYFTDYSYYEAYEALKKLILLRDFYNEGSTDFSCGYSVYGSNIFRFKTCEIRDRFKEEQEELLNTVKPLL